MEKNRNKISIENELDKLVNYNELICSDDFTDNVFSRIGSKKINTFGLNRQVYLIVMILLLNIFTVLSFSFNSDGKEKLRKDNLTTLIKVFSLDD